MSTRPRPAQIAPTPISANAGTGTRPGAPVERLSAAALAPLLDSAAANPLPTTPPAFASSQHPATPEQNLSPAAQSADTSGSRPAPAFVWNPSPGAQPVPRPTIEPIVVHPTGPSTARSAQPDDPPAQAVVAAIQVMSPAAAGDRRDGSAPLVPPQLGHTDASNDGVPALRLPAHSAANRTPRVPDLLPAHLGTASAPSEPARPTTPPPTATSTTPRASGPPLALVVIVVVLVLLLSALVLYTAL